MPEYFHLGDAESQRLQADEEPIADREVWACPANPKHNAGVRRIGELSLQVKHNKRDELIISSWTFDRVVHESLIAEFGKLGFSGFQTRPAIVRFRDGSVSKEYRELVVVGWGGHARVESGIQLIEECSGCHRRSYSGLQDSEQLINWDQWTGEDFFIVWPLPRYTLITKRVADTLASLKVKSYTLGGLRSLEQRNRPQGLPSGFSVSRLSFCLPEDLATKYGPPLGLE
jgi:hypothetical protein